MVLAFPGDSLIMNLPASARDAGSASGSGRSPGVGNGNQPTPVFLSEKSHGHRSLGGGGGPTVHGVAKSCTPLSI